MAAAPDPYAGHDPANTARFAGLVGLVYGAAVVGLAPVAAGGAADLAAGLAVGLLALGSGAAMVRGRVVGYDTLLAGSYLAVVALVALQALYGRVHGELLTELYLIMALGTASVHPPRRTIGVLVAMTAGLVTHELRGGISSLEVADLAVHLGIGLFVALIASSITTQLRRQRALAREDEAHAQTLAKTDALTGLGNRRRLLIDLEAALAEGRPHALALFDLDGFKAYNDSFGHPAGDALLRNLAANLSHAVDGRASAYRMGGDEFCILAPLHGDADAVVADAAAALTEHGGAFDIGASFGFVELPREAATCEEALRDADRRMYANKASGRTSAGRQSTDVLLRVVQERNPELGDHVEDVTDLCGRVADALGLPVSERQPLLQAAALHDIGKTAIPDHILDKPGPLDDDEWAFMRQHTLMGERIMAAAPSLTQAARLVRWSHERIDGGGYPDGLRGEEIPLGARIIAACDAFDAMTTDRPYGAARTTDEAVAELRRCAGAQFDAAVVDALCGVVVSLANRR